MTSRDALTFKRWGEAILRPGLSRTNSWVYCDNLIAWGIVNTESDLSQSPKELSIYATEGYWTGKGRNLRRYSIRIDGFVSMQATLKGGEFVRPPIGNFDATTHYTTPFCAQRMGTTLHVSLRRLDERHDHHFATAS